jgi:hypothetical protein
MNTRYLIAILGLLSQITSLRSQEIPRGTLDRERVLAGETLKVKVVFPQPFSYAPYLQIVFGYKQVEGESVPKDVSGQIHCDMNPNGMPVGLREFDVPCLIPSTRWPVAIRWLSSDMGLRQGVLSGEL